MDWAKTNARRDEKHSSLELGATYIRDLMVFAAVSGHTDDMMQKRHNYIANVLDLHLFHINSLRLSDVNVVNNIILLMGPSGTNFREISIEIHTFSLQKLHWKMSSGKWQPFCLGLSVLSYWYHVVIDRVIKMFNCIVQHHKQFKHLCNVCEVKTWSRNLTFRCINVRKT